MNKVHGCAKSLVPGDVSSNVCYGQGNSSVLPSPRAIAPEEGNGAVYIWHLGICIPWSRPSALWRSCLDFLSRIGWAVAGALGYGGKLLAASYLKDDWTSRDSCASSCCKVKDDRASE